VACFPGLAVGFCFCFGCYCIVVDVVVVRCCFFWLVIVSLYVVVGFSVLVLFGLCDCCVATVSLLFVLFYYYY